jgi:D-3-phosphoglycerate dehydrogenase
MKLLGIGDFFIPKEYIKSGFTALESMGIEVHTIDWNVGGVAELQRINQLVENTGSEIYEIPMYLLDAARDADIIITQFFPVNRSVIDAAKNLKYIGVLRAGYENINTNYASSKGISVFHTPGRNSDAVADFTVGLMICECRNIARGHYGLKKGDWLREYSNSDSIPDLPGKTVGIIGLGEVGKKVAKRLVGFDCRLLGYDPYQKVSDYGIHQVSLEELMKASDFITIHARHTPETENLINGAAIGLMKQTAYLINTSRPALIDEGALYKALRGKRIAGAALDVFDLEPPGRDYPLIGLENVTVTPHMAGGSKDAFLNSPKILADAMIKYFNDDNNRWIVNK